MQYLLLCILMNVGILLIFRAFSQYNIPTFRAIVVNYFVCVLTGAIFLGDVNFIQKITIDQPWVWIAFGLGAIFVGAFYLMALTTQRMGITVSSIASKMSLVIPVIASLFIMNIASRELIIFNYLGIGLALIAILLSSVKSKKQSSTPMKATTLLMPVFVFLFGGTIDTSINYVSHHYLSPATEAIFPIVVFASALCFGIVMLIMLKKNINLKSIVGGIMLGIVNYFSIYFLIKALSAFGNDGAIVYPVINIGIILLSSLASIILFKEELSKINKLGLGLAVVAVLFIFYQELVAQF